MQSVPEPGPPGPPVARQPANDLLARYQPWRRTVEAGFWVTYFCLHAAFNTITVMLDVSRLSLGFAAWEPAVWEWSSNMAMLALVPFILAIERRYPLYLGTFRRNLPWHLAGSILVSLAHVMLMVAARKFLYSLQGAHYDFGDWPRELFYEYLKDVRAYGFILAIVALYRLLMLRLQGEARLLDAPDDGPPVEAVERPERFLVKKLGKEFLLPAQEIEWLQAWGNYVNLRVRGRDYPLRSTLAAIEQRIDPQRFVRVHRSHIVNVAEIVEIEPLEAGDARIRMKDGSLIPCSRRYRDRLRQLAR